MAFYTAFLALLLTSVAPPPGSAQEFRPAAAAYQDQNDNDGFFSGNVVELAANHVTVTRSVLGRPPEKRTFKITESTKVEGKMKQKSRVTVRFVPDDDGDVAVSIIVRADKSDGKKK